MTRQVRSTRAAGKVSIAVALSRILGLARELVFANLFGAGFYYDAWQVAFRIPNFFRDLFAEGAFSAAFVPTFTEFLHKKGRSEAWLLVNLVINALLVLLGSFAVILLLFPNGFVYLVATGFVEVPGKVEVTSTLVKILSPFLLLVALASVAMSVLNTLNRFFLPSLAPAFFNLAVILAGLFLVPCSRDEGSYPFTPWESAQFSVAYFSSPLSGPSCTARVTGSDFASNPATRDSLGFDGCWHLRCWESAPFNSAS